MKRFLPNSSLTRLALAAALATAALAGYWYWYGTVSAESVTVANLAQQVDARTSTAARIASAQTALAQIAGDEAAVRAYFVPEANIVSFIDDLQARGSALGATVAVQSVSASGSAARPSLSLAVTVTGTFDAVMRTVGVFEYAPYDLSITGLAVTEDAKNAWHADVKLVVGSAAASAPPAASTTPTVATSSAPVSGASPAVRKLP